MDFHSLLMLCVIFLVFWFQIKSIKKNWTSFVLQHPPLAYRPTDGAEKWRWGTPPAEIKLRLDDAAEHSRLQLPNILSGVNILGSIVGYAIALSGFALLINLVFLEPSKNGLAGPIFVFIILVAFGRFLLDLDSRLVAIELERDRVSFVVRYGIFLFRRIALRRSAVNSCSGQVQTALSMEKGQKEPLYYVFVRRRFFSKKFFTICDPSQGSWVIAGLENWKQAEP